MLQRDKIPFETHTPTYVHRKEVDLIRDFRTVSSRILIAPLPWGLGHAARSVPLIQAEIATGNDVVIAASGALKAFLEPRFPTAEFIDLPFMTITYPEDGNMVRHFFWRGPKLLRSIWREHQLLQRIIKAKSIQRVISDSRFGLWSKRCSCVFVSHQIHIKSPRMEGLINRLNRWVMSRYDEVWIPDYAEYPGLAGDLSHPARLPKHAKYIGPQSRFKKPVEQREPTWDVVAMISGPEPQRSRFEADLVRQFIEADTHALVLRGKPEASEKQEIGNLKLTPHLDDAALAAALGQTKKVIARSGYSTLMDLNALGLLSLAEFVPTPGQTEQEYLALLHKSV